MNLQKINYQKELEKLLTRLEKEEKVPTLLLHSCCAPCSSYVLEYLSQYFKITVFYYNPNIYPESEYTKRILEQQKLIEEMHFRYPVSFLAGKYARDRFYEMAKGLEEVKEGGMKSDNVSAKNMVYSICFLISRRRMDIRDPSNCLESMVFTVRIIVDASSPIKHVRQKNVCEMTEEVIKIAENKKKSTEFVEIRYILQVCSRHLTL